ncbi:MAG: cobalamin-dependent protein, partial [Syntrophales bacterium]
NMDTIKAALRIYPGRALINSVSGEKQKLKKLLPIAAKYGAMFILLPVTDNEVPETAAKRKEIIREIFRAARSFGFSKDDIVVDGLAMTVAANPGAVIETLKTIDWSTNSFKCGTVLGLSNVSFGMPERKWMNTAFLAMAQAAGLSMAIANPADRELMKVKMAGDVFMKKDRGALSYIRHFSLHAKTDAAAAPSVKSSPDQDIYGAVLEGNRDNIVNLVDIALASGMSPSRLVDDIMIPAINRAGELFDQRKYFLPQLIASAEAMKAALARVEPRLKHEKKSRLGKGVIVIATVKGDIHDIGKNIISLMLKNHGYSIIDLGKDVPAKAVIESMRRSKPDVVGLSALMTTTMVNMEEAIGLARANGHLCPFIVGGAVVTKAYAASIGAAYAKDGVEAVRVVEQLIKSQRDTAK